MANIISGNSLNYSTKRNGDFYDGEWHTDKMNGQGKFTTSKGEVYEGIFRNHRFVS